MSLCATSSIGAVDRRLSNRVGLQLYMLGRIPPADLPEVLRAVRSMGYREVETSPQPGLTPGALRSELDRAGLVCPSCHIGFEGLDPNAVTLAEPAAAIAFAKAVGAKNIVVPMFPMMKALSKLPNLQALLADQSKIGAALGEIARSMSAVDWIEVARQLNAAGETLSRAGLRLGYHNHNIEFVQLPGGGRAYDLLVANTDPKYVDFELDVGWVRAAGLEPSALLKRHSDRITQLHLKDLAATAPNTSLLLNTAELGRGVQDWPALATAIAASSVRHIYVEQEPPYETSGMRSAANAYAFIRPLLAANGL